MADEPPSAALALYLSKNAGSSGAASAPAVSTSRAQIADAIWSDDGIAAAWQASVDCYKVRDANLRPSDEADEHRADARDVRACNFRAVRLAS